MLLEVQERVIFMSTRAQNLIHYTVPSIMGQISFFLFTIFDGVFVGRGVGTTALGAINLVFPFVMTASALFMLTTVGGVTITAIRLGRGDRAGADQAYFHSVAATLGVAVLLCFAGVCLTRPLCRLMGGNETYLPLMAEYLFTYSLFLLPSAASTALSGFGRNDGAPVLVSAAVIAATLVNIGLDWLFVFPLEMGLRGAALATGISQTLCLVIVLPHFLLHRGRLRLRPARPSRPLCRKLLIRGLPECINQISTPVSMLWLNYMLLSLLGEIGVNTYSILAYVASFSMAFFCGAAEGLQPLIGQCYGGREEKDMRFYFASGLLISVVGSLTIVILFCLFSAPVCSLFTRDAATVASAVRAMPQYAWGFVPMAINTMISAYLYSTKRSRQALAINLLRCFGLNTLVILVLPRIVGGGIIWFTFGIYEALCALVAFVLLAASERQLRFH